MADETNEMRASPAAPANVAPQERERSTIVFPYLNLDVAVEIVKGVHATGGQQAQMDALAGHLKESANGGAFRTKIVTAKIFGLVKYSTGTVTLTPLGSRITDPDQEKAARAEAFLHVPLYRRVYEDFKSLVLPPTDAALESVIVTLGVSPKQKSKARQVLLRSAQQAGFFAYGTNKLIAPTFSNTEPGGKQKIDNIEQEKKNDGKTGGAGEVTAASGAGQYHPFIQGLLQTLPTPQAAWPLEGRKKWLASALTIFDLIYEGASEDDALTVTINRGSAK